MSISPSKLAAVAAALVVALVTATPVPAAPGPRWTRYGLGIVKDLAVADVDGDGSPELVVGGRGVGVLEEEDLGSGRFRWANKWLGPDGEPLASDGETVQELEIADLDGDGAADVLAGTDRGLFAIDGGTGATRWFVNDAQGDATNGGAWEVAAGDLNGDGAPDAVFAELLDDRVTAVDGRDGAILWATPRPLGFVHDIGTGDLNGDGATDVVVVGQSDVGLEIMALSGLGAPVTGAALPLWVQRFPVPGVPDGVIGGGGSAGSVDIAQVEPGGMPEVVVGGSQGAAVLAGLTGLPLARMPTGLNTVAGHVAAVNLDGEPDLEIAAAVIDLSDGQQASTVRAFGADGSERWSVPAPASIGDLVPVDVDGDGAPEVVAGGGWQAFGGREEMDGFTMAVDASGVVGWTRRFPEAANAVATGALEGTVLLGHTGALGDGGGLTALDGAGETEWEMRSGGRIEAVAVEDLDGDGIPEVIEGADDSAVAVHDAQGSRLWERRVPGRGGPDVKSVAAGELLPIPGLEVAAGTLEFDEPGPPGRVHLYGSNGARRWSRGVAGVVDAIAVEDVDEDDRAEVLVAAASGSIGDDRGVALRLDPDGGVTWERQVPTGQRTSLALHDLNGDGVDDLVLTKSSVFHGGAVFALDGATGDELWRFELNRSINWASVDAGLGVAAGDIGGTVHRLDGATGSVVWQVDPGNASWGGTWSVDADGDGVGDVVSASHDGAARMLSGTDGSELWSAPTDGNPGYSVATAMGDGGSVVVVGTLGQGRYARAELMLLDPSSGERLLHLGTSSAVLDLTAGDLDADGNQELAAAAGWQLLALDV
jgi:outer membrane protein assembly factor BamB